MKRRFSKLLAAGIVLGALTGIVVGLANVGARYYGGQYPFAVYSNTSNLTTAVFKGTVRVTNNSTAASNVATVMTLDTQSLIDHGYLGSSANDTALRGSTGSDVAYMPAAVDNTTWSLWVPSINADAQLNYTLYMGGGTDMAGSMAYFPGATGMVSTDNDTLELGDNFTVEQNLRVDTSASAVNSKLVNKAAAFRTYVSAAGTVRSAILGGAPTLANQTTNQNGSGTNHTVNLPAGVASGNLLVALITVSYSGDTTIGWPGGWTELFEGANNYANVACAFRTADGTEGASITVTSGNAGPSSCGTYRITGWTGTPEAGVAATGSSASPDPPNLTPSWGSWNNLWIALNGWASASDATNTGYPTNYNLGQQTAHQLSGAASGIAMAGRALTAVSEDPGTFTLDASRFWIANTIAVKGDGEVVAVEASVASGEHLVKTTADGTNLKLYIDDVEQDSAALGGASVPANSNNWTFCEAAAVPYLYTHRIWVDGTLVQHIEWENDDVFGDLSGNGQDATPTVRTASSDPDVSAELVTFEPIDPAESEGAGSSPPPDIVSNPDQPGGAGMYTELNISVPGAALVNAILDGANIPRALFWFPVLMLVIILISFGVYWGTRSLVMKAITLWLCFMFVAALGGWGWWITVPLAIEFFAIVMASKKLSW